MSYLGRSKKPLASHTDDWLMTYVDMITLLLCFFVIFLIVSVSKNNTSQKTQLPPMVKQLDERAGATQPLEPQIQRAAIFLPAPPPDSAPDVFQGNLPFHPIDQTDDPEDPVPAATAAASASASEPVAALPAQEPLPQTLIPAPASLSEIANKFQVQANFDQNGERIKTFEVKSAAFFDSGSATLSKSGIAILQDVCVDLKSTQWKDYLITVEGYTDDTPIHTAQFPSNWELSTGRASAVVHFFLDQGLPAQRLRAAGYADTFPKVPNRDANGKAIPLNQAENRRVVIKLEKIEKN